MIRWALQLAGPDAPAAASFPLKQAYALQAEAIERAVRSLLRSERVGGRGTGKGKREG